MVIEIGATVEVMDTEAMDVSSNDSLPLDASSNSFRWPRMVNFEFHQSR
jgi:hypothetical protein